MTLAVDQQINKFNLHPRAFIALPSILLVLTCVTVSLRMYVRTRMIRAFGLDYWLLLGAFVLFTADVAISLAVGSVQLRRGIISDIDIITKLVISGELIYVVCQIVLKWSMAVFFVRVAPLRWQRLTIYISFTIYALFSSAFFFMGLFQCGAPIHISAFLTRKHCPLHWYNVIGPIAYTAATLNAVIDWIFVLTPILVVYRFLTHRKDKISVCGLVALGGVGSVLSIFRIPLISGLRSSRSLGYLGKNVPITLLSLGESGVGIMAISLAALRPLYSKVVGVVARRVGGTSRSESAPESMDANARALGGSTVMVPVFSRVSDGRSIGKMRDSAAGLALELDAANMWRESV